MNANERKSNPTGQRKKVYRSPRLRVYGDLRRLTRMFVAAKGGILGDGGMTPKTRV